MSSVYEESNANELVAPASHRLGGPGAGAGGVAVQAASSFQDALDRLDDKDWPVSSYGAGFVVTPALGALVEAAGAERLDELLAVALCLEDPVHTLCVAETAWRTQPAALSPLGAFLQIAPLLRVAALVAWARRLRVRGAAELCPLMTRANDTTRAHTERVEAALLAWEQFYDPAAAAVAGVLGAEVPPAVPVYYRYERPEVAARVPFGARRVLEIGCAAGRFGASIEGRQPAAVVGVELNAAAAAEASKVISEVHVGDVEAGVLDEVGGSFDAVVCSDVLEHLKEPWNVLERLAARLRPGGVVVVSLPNLANLRILAALVAGRFDYQDAGILDRTHLRFFTRATAVELLEKAGLCLESVDVVPDPDIGSITVPEPGHTVDVTVGDQLVVRGLDAAHLGDLSAVQFVLTARKRSDDGATCGGPPPRSPGRR